MLFAPLRMRGKSESTSSICADLNYEALAKITDSIGAVTHKRNRVKKRSGNL
jgi:hypothetical protein